MYVYINILSGDHNLATFFFLGEFWIPFHLGKTLQYNLSCINKKTG